MQRLAVSPGSVSRPWWEALAAATDTGPLLGVAALAAVALAVRRRAGPGARVAASVLVVALANPLLKALVGRDRPSVVELAGDVSTGSYPSGHAAVSAALVGALAAAVVTLRPRAGRAARWTVAGVGGSAVLLVAAGQLALGRHFPSDLVAGWLVAGCALAVVRWPTALPWTARSRRS